MLYFPSDAACASSTCFNALFIHVAIKSSNISTSSGSNTSGFIFIAFICLLPETFTFTASPPADASNSFAANSSCDLNY